MGGNSGNKISTKADNTLRLVHLNLNCLQPKVYNNKKLTQLQTFLRRQEINVSSMVELQVNWTKVHRGGQLRELLCTETLMRVVMSHNTHESNGWHQEGGMAIAAFDYVSTRVDMWGNDPVALRQWAWIQFSGQHRPPIRLVTAYLPVYQTCTHVNSVYQQRMRFYHANRHKVSNPCQ